MDLEQDKETIKEYDDWPLHNMLANIMKESSTEGSDLTKEQVESSLVTLSPRFKGGNAGVEEWNELTATLQLISNHMSDPDFISMMPDDIKDSALLMAQELSKTEAVMGEIAQFISHGISETAQTQDQHKSINKEVSMVDPNHRRLGSSDDSLKVNKMRASDHFGYTEEGQAHKFNKTSGRKNFHGNRKFRQRRNNGFDHSFFSHETMRNLKHEGVHNIHHMLHHHHHRQKGGQRRRLNLETNTCE
mgnify:CR=1 FL=1